MDASEETTPFLSVPKLAGKIISLKSNRNSPNPACPCLRRSEPRPRWPFVDTDFQLRTELPLRFFRTSHRRLQGNRLDRLRFGS
jgi:hypothetical protein